MHIVFDVILALITVIILILLAAFFSQPEVTITGEIIINQPSRKVFDFIKQLKNQEYYNKWVMADPNMKREYKGTDGTVGFVYSWQSENKQVGKGEQEIKKIIDDEQVDSEIRFMEPYKSVARVSMITKEVSDNRTRVKTIFRGTRNFKMRLIYLVFNIKKILGRDFERNLITLKTILEKQ